MSASIVSPGTDMLVRGLAISAMAIVVMNYYGLGGVASILSTQNLVPALVIGVGALLVELYLPRAEYYVESQV